MSERLRPDETLQPTGVEVSGCYGAARIAQ